MQDLDLIWLRRQLITAVTTDEELCSKLILKGGNALSLVHGVGNRASLDIDYSMETDVEDHDALRVRLVAALRGHLGPLGLVLFDEQFSLRPKQPGESAKSRWGGYCFEFKLIRTDRYEALAGDVGRSRRQALSVDGHGQASRRFRIEISKYEFVDDRMEKQVVDGHVCQVYTLDLMAAEKLRSLCQQMDGYEHRQHPTPRARDFYDLHALLTEGAVELSEDHLHELVRAVFDAKSVPLGLLGSLDEYREFHRADWPAVLNAIPGDRPREFDFYVDFLLSEVRKLQPLWVINAP